MLHYYPPRLFSEKIRALFVIEREDDEAGRVIVHFPNIGFEVVHV